MKLNLPYSVTVHAEESDHSVADGEQGQQSVSAWVSARRFNSVSGMLKREEPQFKQTEILGNAGTPG